MLVKLINKVKCYFGKHKPLLKWERTEVIHDHFYYKTREYKAKIRCKHCGIKVDKIHYSEIIH